MKIAPTVTLGLLPEMMNVQVLGSVSDGGLGAIVVQLVDHPPNATPGCSGAVKVTVVPMG